MTAKKTRHGPGGQHREFVKAARELGCDEAEAAFDKALKKVASAPPPTSVKKRKVKKATSSGRVSNPKIAE